MTGDLTLTEQKHVRVALRLLRLRVGGWKPLAKVLHLHGKTLDKACNGSIPVTAGMAFRVARFVEMPIDDLLIGRYAPAGTCPRCGHVPDFADEETTTDGS